MDVARRSLAIAVMLAVGTVMVTGVAPSEAQQSFNQIVVVHDIVRGSWNVPKDEVASKVCVLNSRFLHKEQVAWRIKLLDPTTGALLDDKAVQRLEVKLVSGETFVAKYGTHPRQNPTDKFWSTAWTIPESYPSGTVPYMITATGNDGRTSMAVTFNVNLAQLTVLDGAIPIPK